MSIRLAPTFLSHEGKDETFLTFTFTNLINTPS